MLNLFSWLGVYKTLPAQLADAEARCIKAEDDARYWRSKAEVWEEQANKAQEQKDISHQLLIDWCAIRLTGKPIFGNPPALPREQFPGDKEPEMPRMGKRLGRDMVNDYIAKMERAIMSGTIRE